MQHRRNAEEVTVHNDHHVRGVADDAKDVALFDRPMQPQINIDAMKRRIDLVAGQGRADEDLDSKASGAVHERAGRQDGLKKTSRRCRFTMVHGSVQWRRRTDISVTAARLDSKGGSRWRPTSQSTPKNGPNRTTLTSPGCDRSPVAGTAIRTPRRGASRRRMRSARTSGKDRLSVP